jgi:hypothetical protein
MLQRRSFQVSAEVFQQAEIALLAVSLEFEVGVGPKR